jgi:cell division septation protein DedD
LKVVAIIIAAILVLAAAGGAAWYFLGSGGSGDSGVQVAPSPVENQAGVTDPSSDKAETGDKSSAAAVPPPRRVEDAAKPENWPVFSIELATFRNLDKAREYLAAISQRDIEAELVETVDAGGRAWYHVRTGKFDDPRQAAARLPDVERKTSVYGVVVTEIPAAAAK